MRGNVSFLCDSCCCILTLFVGECRIFGEGTEMRRKSIEIVSILRDTNLSECISACEHVDDCKLA